MKTKVILKMCSKLLSLAPDAVTLVVAPHNVLLFWYMSFSKTFCMAITKVFEIACLSFFFFNCSVMVLGSKESILVVIRAILLILQDAAGCEQNSSCASGKLETTVQWCLFSFFVSLMFCGVGSFGSLMFCGRLFACVNPVFLMFAILNVCFWESKHKGKDFVKSTNKKLILFLCTRKYCTY